MNFWCKLYLKSEGSKKAFQSRYLEQRNFYQKCYGVFLTISRFCDSLFRRQKKREKDARKKNLKRARAASLGNAFSEIEQLLAFTVNPRAEQEEDTEEVTLEKIEECQEMLKSLQSRFVKLCCKNDNFWARQFHG